MLNPDFLTQIEKIYKNNDYIGEETFNGAKVQHVKLNGAEAKFSADLFFDAQTKLLIRVTADLSNLIRSGSGAPGDAPSDHSLHFEELHSNIKLNEKINDKVFEFSPPPGAKKVDDVFARESPPAPETGKPAPAFALDCIEAGKKVKLDDFKGKVVMLDFWATWCGPCRMELPILQKIHEKYKDKKFAFVAINVREEKSKVSDFATKQKFTFPVALDADGATTGNYMVSAFPTLFLIDQKGVVKQVHMGYDPAIEQTLQSEIDALLAGKELPKTEPSKDQR
jgi:thiol-disulfide isomerase/thioredoxin